MWCDLLQVGQPSIVLASKQLGPVINERGDAVLISRHSALLYFPQQQVPRIWVALPPTGVRYYSTLRIRAVTAIPNLNLNVLMYLRYLIILVISSNNRLFFKGTELLQLLFLRFTGVLHFREDILAQQLIHLPPDDELGIWSHWNHVRSVFGHLQEPDWRKLRNTY